MSTHDYRTRALIDEAGAELRRLRDLNAQLLDALQRMVFHHGNPKRDEWLSDEGWQSAVATDAKARAAIAAATKEAP